MLHKPEESRIGISIAENYVFDETGGVVLTGPFKGMQMSRVKCWGGSRMAPMLLGCFEKELHWCLEEQIERLEKLPNPRIVNVGSAEGYYAVGLARRLPHPTVWAVDCDENSNRVCRLNADHNNVINLITEADVRDAMAAPDLIVADCEGNEVEYINYDNFPDVRKAAIIVELHDLPEKPNRPAQWTSRILFERCKDTHSITVMTEGGRDPNQYACLVGLDSDRRWTAVSEGRPCLMAWYYMRPK